MENVTFINEINNGIIRFEQKAAKLTDVALDGHLTSSEITMKLALTNLIENAIYKKLNTDIPHAVVYNTSCKIAIITDLHLINPEETQYFITNGATIGYIVNSEHLFPFVNYVWTVASDEVRIYVAKLDVALDNKDGHSIFPRTIVSNSFDRRFSTEILDSEIAIRNTVLDIESNQHIPPNMLRFIAETGIQLTPNTIDIFTNKMTGYFDIGLVSLILRYPTSIHCAKDLTASGFSINLDKIMSLYRQIFIERGINLTMLNEVYSSIIHLALFASIFNLKEYEILKMIGMVIDNFKNPEMLNKLFNSILTEIWNGKCDTNLVINVISTASSINNYGLKLNRKIVDAADRSIVLHCIDMGIYELNGIFSEKRLNLPLRNLITQLANEDAKKGFRDFVKVLEDGLLSDGINKDKSRDYVISSYREMLYSIRTRGTKIDIFNLLDFTDPKIKSLAVDKLEALIKCSIVLWKFLNKNKMENNFQDLLTELINRFNETDPALHFKPIYNADKYLKRLLNFNSHFKTSLLQTSLNGVPYDLLQTSSRKAKYSLFKILKDSFTSIEEYNSSKVNILAYSKINIKILKMLKKSGQREYSEFVSIIKTTNIMNIINNLAGGDDISPETRAKDAMIAILLKIFNLCTFKELYTLQNGKYVLNIAKELQENGQHKLDVDTIMLVISTNSLKEKQKLSKWLFSCDNAEDFVNYYNNLKTQAALSAKAKLINKKDGQK